MSTTGRTRKIRPEIFKDDRLGSCSMSARLLFMGLLVFSSKQGKITDDAGKIHRQVIPHDDSFPVSAALQELHDAGIIERFSVDNVGLIQIINISKWCEIKPQAKDHAPEAKRRALRRNALPAWANLVAIKEVYKEAKARSKAGENCHVDHIIPMAGKNVCGLHTHLNLQIIPAAENLKKSNKYQEEP
jgi:hypothetical protein